MALPAGPDDIVFVSVNGDVQRHCGSARKLRESWRQHWSCPRRVRTGRDGSTDLRQGDTTIAIGPGTELDFPASGAPDGPVDRIVQPLGNAFYYGWPARQAPRCGSRRPSSSPSSRARNSMSRSNAGQRHDLAVRRQPRNSRARRRRERHAECGRDCDPQPRRRCDPRAADARGRDADLELEGYRRTAVR